MGCVFCLLAIHCVCGLRLIYLRYAKNCDKLVCFQEERKIFCNYKTSQLNAIFDDVKMSFWGSTFIAKGVST
jgi:hypothetical protein